MQSLQGRHPPMDLLGLALAASSKTVGKGLSMQSLWSSSWTQGSFEKGGVQGCPAQGYVMGANLKGLHLGALSGDGSLSHLSVFMSECYL